MIKFIMSCISTSRISILINTGRTNFLNPTRGIRYPYIFKMYIELLSWRIDHEVGLLNWTSISISTTGPKISRLFFTNDLTLFVRANSKTCQTIMNPLNSFSHHPGQKVDPSNSKVIFSQNCSKKNRELLAQGLNIEVRNDFGKY